MPSANIDLLYEEMKTIHRELEKTNALLLSLLPEVKIKPEELARLKKIKAEMDAGASTPYSKDLF